MARVESEAASGGIGLVDKQVGVVPLHQFDRAPELLFAHHCAGRVVRRREAHQPGVRRDQRGEPIGVDLVLLFELQLEERQAAPDRARRVEVRHVIRERDDGARIAVEERRRDDEQGHRRAGRDQHVVCREPVALRGDQLTQVRLAAMVHVRERQVAEIEVEVGQEDVADGALGEILGERVRARLVGRFPLHR
jgi:hypothetical protein